MHPQKASLFALEVTDDGEGGYICVVLHTSSVVPIHTMKSQDAVNMGERGEREGAITI